MGVKADKWCGYLAAGSANVHTIKGGVARALGRASETAGCLPVTHSGRDPGKHKILDSEPVADVWLWGQFAGRLRVFLENVDVEGCVARV